MKNTLNQINFLRVQIVKEMKLSFFSTVSGGMVDKRSARKYALIIFFCPLQTVSSMQS